MASLTWFVLLLAGLTYTHALGTETTIQDLPSIAQVEFRLTVLWRRQCAGSIINNFHILSAASCFRADPSVRQIRVGSATSGYGGITREVANINNHPDGDLSVVRTSINFWFGPTIQNIPIVPQDFLIPANVDLSIAGWGITAQGGLVANNNLYRANVQSKAITVCMTQFPERVTSENLCVGLVGRLGRDFDPSDAGAPIMYLDYLAGVASFGSSSTYDLLPTVSSAVGAYTNWIISSAS